MLKKILLLISVIMIGNLRAMELVTVYARLFDPFSGNVEQIPVTLDKNVAELHSAIEHNQVGVVRNLLENDVSMNLIEALGTGSRRPLHVAAEHGQRDVAELLLNHKADIQAKMPGLDLTPLHLATTYKNTEVVRLLLERGARIDAADWHGETALHRAAELNQLPLCKLMLSFIKKLPKEAEVAFALPRLRMALFCLKKISENIALSKELQYTILLSISELRENTAVVLLHLLSSGRQLVEQSLYTTPECRDAAARYILKQATPLLDSVYDCLKEKRSLPTNALFEPSKRECYALPLISEGIDRQIKILFA